MAAYAPGRRRTAPRSIVLDFSGLEYMNSGGIGLLVTLLVRAQRGGGRLLATGLSDHYRQIFALTRLDEAIEIHDDEAAAVAAARGLTRRRDRGRPMTEPGDPTSARDPSRDAANWAQPVDRLSAPASPAPRTTPSPASACPGPLQGFGQLWQKTFTVRLDGVDTTPEAVIATWKAQFADVLAEGRSGSTRRLRASRPGEVAPARDRARARARRSSSRPASWSSTRTTSRSRS